MARPTQQEIDEWNARMAEPEEDDDDFEVVLFNDQGQPVGTMPYSRAKAHFKRHGIDLDAELPGTDSGANAANAAGDPNAGPANPASNARRPRTTSTYFGGKGARGQAAPQVDPNLADPGGNPAGR